MSVFDQWQEPDPEVLDWLARHGTAAADRPVIDAIRTGVSSVRNPDGSTQPPTGAELTAVGVRAAIRCLLANGLIQAAAPDPGGYVLLDPPTERNR